MGFKNRRLAVAVAAVCAMTGLSACGDSPSNKAATNSAGQAASGHAPTIAFVGNFPSSDPFGSVVVNGYEAALKTFGAKGEYRGAKTANFVAADQQRAIEAAIAQKPDGLVVTDPAPEGLNASIKQAVDAGIQVVLTNSGSDQLGATGALTYVGNDEGQAGRLGGDALAKAGAKHALLYTIQPGIPLVDARNEGFKAGFKGQVTDVAVPQSDLGNSTKLKSVLDAALLKDKSIDAVFSVGAIFNPPMLAERASLGGRADTIRWSSIDLGDQVVKALQNGQMEFAVDQQPYLQGYLPVQVLALRIRYGFDPVAQILPTGPTLVTKQTVGDYARYAKEGIR
jgi:simple sugar transport system substrate-binding protein